MVEVFKLRHPAQNPLRGVRHNVPLIPVPSYFFDLGGFTGCSFTSAWLMSFSKSSELVLAIP